VGSDFVAVVISTRSVVSAAAIEFPSLGSKKNQRLNPIDLNDLYDKSETRNAAEQAKGGKLYVAQSATGKSFW
jgi:hypothetical protein